LLELVDPYIRSFVRLLSCFLVPLEAEVEMHYKSTSFIPAKSPPIRSTDQHCTPSLRLASPGLSRNVKGIGIWREDREPRVVRF
jgi:hypothetical protein